MPGWALMQAMRCILAQICPVENDRGWHAGRTVPIFPPVFDKLALVDHMICQARPYIGKVSIAIDRAQGVAESRPVDAVNPVDAIEALHDPDPTPSRFSYRRSEEHTSE